MPTALERILFIPDCHVPYEDHKAFSLLLRAAHAFKPDTVAILGDFADFYAVSDHDKNPNRARNIEWEIDAVNTRLDQLDKLGAKNKLFVKGNHEWRLERYLMRRAPELYNIVNIREFFHLDERGWKTVEYMDDARIGKLYITHDTGRAGKYAHYQSQADYEANCIIGHTHRMGYMVSGTARGKPHVGAMFGCLLDFSKVDYMHKRRALRDWSHGFGVGFKEPDGTVHLQPIPIVNGKVVIAGQLIK